VALLVGLGNVGAEYEGTRHNIGFDIVEKLANKLGSPFQAGDGSFEFAQTRYKGKNLFLVKPTNYMNNSGSSVMKAMVQFNQKPEHSLIIYDDLHLTLGVLKLRPKGSDGGHNGIADVHDKINSQAIPRLRIGIGNDFPRGRQIDFVLSSFRSEDVELVKQMIDNAVQACLDFVGLGINRAMNIHN
tara:strand:+ start:1740 stop:2297 length:558 start_codon:yes stop_codon:yes gene_type:complete